MQKTPQLFVLFIIMVIVIVAIDFLVFRNHFWARLLVNVGIVLVTIAFYLRFMK